MKILSNHNEHGYLYFKRNLKIIGEVMWKDNMEVPYKKSNMSQFIQNNLF